MLATLILVSMPLGVASAQTTVTFESAEFVLSDASRAPSDAAAWQRVALPHKWHDTHPGVTGLGWYRIAFDLAQVPRQTQAITVAHWRSRFVDFYINGSLIGGSRDVTSTLSLGMGAGVYLTIPPSLLREGKNVIHARMQTVAAPINIQGLGRLLYGDGRPVRKAFIMNSEWGFMAERTFLAMALAAGLITLFVWLARRSDRIVFWFSIACLAWALAGILWNALRWSDMHLIVDLLNRYVAYGLVVPAVVLAFRSADLKLPWLEAAMWTYLAIEIGFPLWGRIIVGGTNVPIVLAFHAINAMLLLAGVVIIWLSGMRPLRWPIHLEAVALLAMAAVMLYEAARILGWFDIEGPVLRPFHVPVMLLAIGAAIYERHVASIWRMERANFDLERRVADKTREIEAAHASVEEANRARALAQERQRILGDMHDGVGASLVGLLRYVQSGNTDPQDLERRVRGALQEMRIAVDALEPADGDLGAVLGKLRYRLEPLVDASGARFVWDVAPLPRVEALEPASVFAIQRIVLEAIANVLNHSGAREIRVSVRDQATRGIEVRIEDDGEGFDASAATNGLGLRNMRSRADRLDAELLVESIPGKGTCVRLLVPYQLPTRSNDPAVAPTSAAVPELTVLVPSAG
jgi:signal transduction histidine kinase